MSDKWYINDEKPELDDDLLCHYGVKGMKWRHRKKRGKKVYQKRKPQTLEDLYAAYSKWYSNTKLGKFMDTPIPNPFGHIESQASSTEDEIYWKTGEDGEWHKYKNGKRID